jgi:putative transposase
MLFLIFLSAMEKIIHHSQFFTATIMGWKKLLQPDKYKIAILQELKCLVKDNKIILYAYCLMDNHIHLIWQIKGNYNPSEIQKSLLQNSAKYIKNDLAIYHPNVLKLFASTQKDRSFHFWKRRALSIDLYSDFVFYQKLDYIHENPVKAGLCSYPEEYIFSSARFYLDGTDSWNILTHCDA